MKISVNVMNAVIPSPERGFKNYQANREPLVKKPLVKLPLGSIKASGWIRKQLELMKGGMTGRLSELSNHLDENNGWLGGDGDGWEEQAYWFRGFFDLAVLLQDKPMLDKAWVWIDLILNTKDDDGYFGPKNCKGKEIPDGRIIADVWPHMVMIDAIRSYYEVTNDSRVIDLLTGFFHWCESLRDDQFLPGYDVWDIDWRLYIQTRRAGDMLPHIYWLYNRTGGEWLLKLAARFMAGLSQPEGEWLSTHIVDFTQRFRFFGNYYMQTGNPADLACSEEWYHQHMAVWGQQPGGIFAADEYIRPGKTDPKQGFETCGMVEFNKSFYILSEITGEIKYADRVEDIIFNSFPVSQPPDMKGVHYLTAGNLPQLDASENHDFYNKYRQLVYSAGSVYRCCQHNIAMGWPYYSEHLWMAAAGDGLAACLYGECEVTARVGNGVDVIVREKTGYPFDMNVVLQINPAVPVAFPLYLRIPAWSAQTILKLNGNALDIRAEAGKYVMVEREWQENDVVELIFTPEIQIKRWEMSGNSATVYRGPLSYSLKIGEDWRRCGGSDEWPEWEIFPTTAWNYGILLDNQDAAGSIRVKKQAGVAEQPWTIEAAPIELSARGKRIQDWKLIDETVEEVPKSPVKSDQPVEEITLIPMGCARLRISCFPVIDEDRAGL